MESVDSKPKDSDAKLSFIERFSYGQLDAAGQLVFLTGNAYRRRETLARESAFGAQFCDLVPYIHSASLPSYDRDMLDYITSPSPCQRQKRISHSPGNSTQYPRLLDGS